METPSTMNIYMLVCLLCSRLFMGAVNSLSYKGHANSVYIAEQLYSM